MDKRFGCRGLWVTLGMFFWLGARAIAQDGSSVTPQAPPTWAVPSNEEIHALLAERMAHNGVGIVVGIVDLTGRRVISHGRSGSNTNRPLDGDTVFQIGSVTKVFTTLLLADMVQRGEVSIEDPASRFLPRGVTMPERGRPITLLDLATHRSGLPSMPTNFTLTARPNPYATYTPEQLFQFLSTYELPREPGVTAAYSNLGVALSGRLLGAHVGVEYEALLTERILLPLGLKSTSVKLNADQRQRLAPGHDRFLSPVSTSELFTMPASGSLRSTTNDLLTLLAAYIDERDFPLKSAMAHQRTRQPSAGSQMLGLGIARLRDIETFGHDGGKEGYRSAIQFDVKRKIGIVVLANARTDDLPIDLARHLISGRRLPPVRSAPTQPALAKLSAKMLDAYSGTYRLESGAIVKIVRRDRHLLVDVRGDGVAAFFPSSAHEFFSRIDDEQIAFEARTGRATGFQWTVRGKSQRGTRIEH